MMASFAVAVVEARSARSADEVHRRAVLTWLRCLHVRIAMFEIEVDTIGVALRDDRVTPDDALAWLQELDPRLLDLVGAEVDQ